MRAVCIFSILVLLGSVYGKNLDSAKKNLTSDQKYYIGDSVVLPAEQKQARITGGEFSLFKEGQRPLSAWSKASIKNGILIIEDGTSAVYNYGLSKLGLSNGKFPFSGIKLKMKVFPPKAGLKLRIHFRGGTPLWRKGVLFDVVADGKYHDYTFDISRSYLDNVSAIFINKNLGRNKSGAFWKGNIVYIKEIALLAEQLDSEKLDKGQTLQIVKSEKITPNNGILEYAGLPNVISDDKGLQAPVYSPEEKTVNIVFSSRGKKGWGKWGGRTTHTRANQQILRFEKSGFPLKLNFGLENLDKADVLIVPSNIKDKSANRKIMQFLEKGGSVICFETNSSQMENWLPVSVKNANFTCNAGPKTKYLPNAKFKIIPSRPLPVIFKGIPLKEYPMPPLVRYLRVKAKPSAEVLAKFDTGDPAIIYGKYGKGKVLYFAFQALSGIDAKSVNHHFQSWWYYVDTLFLTSVFWLADCPEVVNWLENFDAVRKLRAEANRPWAECLLDLADVQALGELTGRNAEASNMSEKLKAFKGQLIRADKLIEEAKMQKAESLLKNQLSAIKKLKSSLKNLKRGLFEKGLADRKFKKFNTPQSSPFLCASDYNGNLWVLGGIARAKYDAYLDLRRTIYNRMYGDIDNYLAVTTAYYQQILTDFRLWGYGELPPEKFSFRRHEKLLDLLNGHRKIIPRFDRGVAYKDFVSEKFLKNLEKVWDKISKRFNDDKAVIAIQPWNEPGIRENKFRTPDGIARFHEYLRNKFGTLEKLNKVFHSNYKSWDEIQPPLEKEIENLNEPKDKQISLNTAAGYLWKLRLDPDDRGEKNQWQVSPPDDGWHVIEVPGRWEKSDVPGAASYNGLAWYKLNFDVSGKGTEGNQRVFLSLKAVDDNCRVYLNGRMLAESKGYTTPVEVDITRNLKTKNNSLLVRVEDTGGGGGIYKNVSLKMISGQETSRRFSLRNNSRRAVWNEWLNFQANWMGVILKTLYSTVKKNTSKPFVDRSIGYAMTMHGKAINAANRPEIMSKYCDIYGPHTQGEFALDYSRGHNQAPKMWLSEWYWSGYGYKTEKGEWPMKFMKFTAAFILHPQSAERWAASRAQLSFWEAVSRGVSGVQMWNADPSSGPIMNYTGCDPLWFCHLWSSDSRPRMPLFVMLEMSKRFQDIQGNVLPGRSKSRSRVAIIEPLDTMLQFSYNTDNSDESRALHDLFVSNGFMTDIIPQNEKYTNYSVLILPYAPFIAQERQTRLLDFVKKGGILLLEGPCGLYDQYGNPGAELLSQGFGTTKMMEIGSKAPQLSSGEKLPEKSLTYFTLADVKRGKSKGHYKTGEPYFTVSKLGKGKIVFLGMAIGKMAGISGFGNIDDAMLMDKKKTGNLKDISFSDKTKRVAAKIISDFLREIPFKEAAALDNPKVRTYWRTKNGNLILFVYNRDLVDAQSVNVKLPAPKTITDLLLKIQFESDNISLNLPPGAGRVYVIDNLKPYIAK